MPTGQGFQRSEAMAGGQALQAGVREALGNKFGTNAQNSMTVTSPATSTTTKTRGGFLGFKKGGIVPGRGPRKAIVHGGELVVPADKVGKVMGEFKAGTLRSGSGGKVRKKKQAIAIGLSEARKAGQDVAPKPLRSSYRKVGY